MKLVPYPKVVERRSGSLVPGPPVIVEGESPVSIPSGGPDSLRRCLPRQGRPVPVRLTSATSGLRTDWLDAESARFLADPSASLEAHVVSVTPEHITVAGRGASGILYGLQTVNQLALAAAESRDDIPCLVIRDWPDLAWRCLAPQLTWYSGFNRLEGFDCGNWAEGEWRRLADWSLLHKLNAWAVCMYGYWPFRLPGYEETTLDVESFRRDPETGRRTPYRFVHSNIRRKFFPDVIAYAHDRGIKVHAYIGLNSFNGGYLLHHPEADAGGCAELQPFAPGVRAYWRAFLERMADMGFDGFVLEDPEAFHVPNADEDSYRAFWRPWEKTYSFSGRSQTDSGKPPLGVHIEYHTWLVREFVGHIRACTAGRGRAPEVRLIGHVVLKRILDESRTTAERTRWRDLLEERSGERFPYIVEEQGEAEYVALLGANRTATLGGRSASCICAMRRNASVNNNAEPAGFGAGVDHECACHRRMVAAGGIGGTAYAFEWRLCEVYAYVGAQFMWNAAGVPGVNNQDQTAFLDYACRDQYGDDTGALAARALDQGPAVNEAMLVNGIHGLQYPNSGCFLSRDLQLLAANADTATGCARAAFRAYTGQEPDLLRPLYDSEGFAWDGYDRAADRLFEAETLRRLCVSARRAQCQCAAALALHRAERLVAEGAALQDVLTAMEEAVAAAAENEELYQVNYDDDYDPVDGMCTRITAYLRAKRQELCARSALRPERPVAACASRWLDHEPLFIPWEKVTEILPEERTAPAPGLYLSIAVGLNEVRTVYCHGVAFTILAGGSGDVLFRRVLGKSSRGWEEWDIPVTPGPDGRVGLRLVTDSYSRAHDRSAPSWRWALWGAPRLVQVCEDGERRTICDPLAGDKGMAAAVRLDRDRAERPFDALPVDSTGAEVRWLAAAEEGVRSPGDLFCLTAFTPHREGAFGVTIVDLTL